MSLKESFICYGCRWCGRAEFDDQDGAIDHFLNEHGDDDAAIQHYVQDDQDVQHLAELFEEYGVELPEKIKNTLTIIKTTGGSEE